MGSFGFTACESQFYVRTCSASCSFKLELGTLLKGYLSNHNEHSLWYDTKIKERHKSLRNNRQLDEMRGYFFKYSVSGTCINVKDLLNFFIFSIRSKTDFTEHFTFYNDVISHIVILFLKFPEYFRVLDTNCDWKHCKYRRKKRYFQFFHASVIECLTLHRQSLPDTRDWRHTDIEILLIPYNENTVAAPVEPAFTRYWSRVAPENRGSAHCSIKCCYRTADCTTMRNIMENLLRPPYGINK